MANEVLGPVTFFRGDASTTNVTTAWQVVTTALSTDIRAIDAFSGTGTVLELGYGPSTTSVTSFNYLVMPGAPNFRVGILMNQSMNVYMRSVDANATAGVIVFNFLR